MKLFTGNALWALVKQSDTMSLIVLLLLFGMSIVCWAVALYKFMQFRQRNYELKEAVKRLHSVHSVEQLLVVGQALVHTTPGLIITRALARAKTLLGEHVGLKKGLSSADYQMVHAELDGVIADTLVQEEKWMPILKVSAEVAPLLGLFGTIWGLIHSFVRISEEQSADIVTVAPGIAEALITTLVGLMVAIPALVLYHALNRRLAEIEHRLIAVADCCERVIHVTLSLREPL